MKAKNKIYIGGMMLLAGVFTSCSDNYLDLTPQTAITNASAIATVDGAKLAMIGVCQTMWQQWQGMGNGYANSYYNFNGEAYLNHRMNDAFGPDLHSGIGMAWWGYDQLAGDPSVWGQEDYILNFIPWMYSYNMISQANTVLDGIDDAEGDANERNFIKAQLLTLRAHGYTKLMMYFAPRWENSNNGNVYCAVMRDKGGIEDAPLCTMNDVFKLIYSDLDTAIELYQESGLKRDEKWMPDLSVAYGIYARAAMIIHDYEKAQTMAHNAWQGYKIMDNDTYLSGFNTDNEDFMWESSDVQTDVYYYSEFNWYAGNGVYLQQLKKSDGIDMELYRQMDENDIRRLCYFTPDKIKLVESYGSRYNPGKITEDYFWDPTLVNQSNYLDVSFGPYASDRRNPNKTWGLYNVAFWYCYLYGNEIFKGDPESIHNIAYDSYNNYNLQGGPIDINANTSGTLLPLVFGGQMKFMAYFPSYGAGAYPFMRAAEMKLLEAEAACRNEDYTTAKSIINEIRGMRIDGYSGYTGSDANLLSEVQLETRIETWGEGHNWSDFKRWNLPITRKAWEANDPTSGNWYYIFAIDTPVNINSGWRMRLPRAETQFNKAIDRSLLDYSN